MKRKLIYTALTALLLCAMTGCGEDISSSQSTGSSTAETSAAETSAADTASSTPDSSEPAANSTEPVNAAAGSISFDYNANGTVIEVGAEAAPILEALGNYDSVFEAPSCAFTGVSYYYTYGGMQVVTYPDEFDQSLNRIYEVDLTDDTVATNEGIRIGNTYDDLIAAYGTPDQETAAYATYRTDGKEVQFFLTGNDITSIIYTIKLG